MGEATDRQKSLFGVKVTDRKEIILSIGGGDHKLSCADASFLGEVLTTMANKKMADQSRPRKPKKA